MPRSTEPCMSLSCLCYRKESYLTRLGVEVAECRPVVLEVMKGRGFIPFSVEGI